MVAYGEFSVEAMASNPLGKEDNRSPCEFHTRKDFGKPAKSFPFLAIFKTIMAILRDRNYKKYAIRKPKNIKQINKIDNWARQITINKIK